MFTLPRWDAFLPLAFHRQRVNGASEMRQPTCNTAAVVRRRTLRLRTRVTLFFAFIAVLAGVVLIGVTYGLTRNNLVGEDQNAARQQAFANADLIRQQLTVDPDGIGVFFDDELRTDTNGFAVLSSDDPVRVFERFSTLDAVSNGRAEVILGRGSFTESFPLFGYDLEKYELLFDEKLQLFAELLKEQAVTWSGRTRAALTNQLVYPPTESGSLKVWVAVGGSIQSVVRAAHYGMPLMLAIIGGEPLRFRPFVDQYERALDQFGKPHLPVGVHSPGYIAATDEQAREEAWPHYAAMHARIGRERGWSGITRQQFEATAGPDGAFFVGSPHTVATKIAKVVRGLRLSRFDLKYSLGTLPHEQLMESIRLYGKEVAPMVREELGRTDNR